MRRPTSDAEPTIRGYARQSSVKQGATISFAFSSINATAPTNYPVRIIRLGQADVTYYTGTEKIHARKIKTTDDLSQDWPTTFSVRIGSNWPSGIYVARVGDGLADAPDVIFVVRAARAGATSSIVVQLPTATINAYCNFGGKSLYWYNSVPQPAPKVSFDRPLQSDGQWMYGFGFDEEYRTRIRDFYLWLELSGRKVEYITSEDLHDEATLLSNYQLFITIGHDEYWSRDMRNHFDAFINGGGNAAILGGNVCLWQIRFEDSTRRQVCYKSITTDPVANPVGKTTTWIEVGQPSNISFGPGYAYGGWIGASGLADIPFTVYQPEHWALSGTRLTRGATFGANERLLRYEVDGCDYRMDVQGRPQPTGSDGTPTNFRILALAKLINWDNGQGNAAMGVMTRSGVGGTVFHAATTNWASGLYDCVQAANPTANVVGQITANVIDHLTPALFVASTLVLDDAQLRPVYYADDYALPRLYRSSNTLAFKAFSRPLNPSLVPLSRFESGNSSFNQKELLSISRAAPAAGWAAAGIACYVYTTAAEDRVPVYRFSQTNSTVGYVERYSLSATKRNGETAHGVMFYAPK